MGINSKGSCCRKVDYPTKGEAENVTSIWVIKNGTNGRSWFMALFEFSKLV